jgi:hypothetical protein
MKRVGKAGIAWNGLLERLTGCVSAWRPRAESKEVAYSRALAAYLRDCLPEDTHIENEYRHVGETLDVYVRFDGLLSSDEVFIEVKRRLIRKAEFNRLVGQVMSLEPGKNRILIVLIGDCDVELTGRLRLQFKRHIQQGPLLIDVPTMNIVEVPEEHVSLDPKRGSSRYGSTVR